MNHKFEDLSPLLSNHVDDVSNIMDALQPFHAAREETYNLSFARRGESGVWMNLARKYDRLDLLASHVLEGANGNAGVTLVDNLIDTAMYALKWVAVIRKLRPEDFKAWIEQVYCRDTGMDLDMALLLFADDMTLAEIYVEYIIQELGNDLYPA